MRSAARLLLFAALGPTFLLIACGGDDDGDATGTPTRTSTTQAETRTPESTGDEKTPGPDETPDGGTATPVDTSTPPPTGIGGKAAPRVENVSDFFAQFRAPPEDERQCVYNPSTRLIDCSDRGVYAPDPPAVGQGIECYLMVTEANAVVVRCEIADPQGTAYYDVR
jgi:hypothetical protein